MCKRNVLFIFLLIFSLSFVAAIGTKEEVSEGPWTPSETIKIIVPWSAGGGTDTLGRALAKHGKEYFGVPVVVENIEGAMGGIGAQRVKNSKPEGYALLLMSGFVSWIGLVQDYPVDVEDFTPIMNLNRDPAAFAVSVDSDIYTLEDLQKYCLAHPGEFSVAHSGDGGTWHIAGVTLADSLGVDMNFVPFNGTAPGVAAVMGNKIQGVSGGAAEFVSQALGNQLRVLAVLSEDRLGPLPDVKTAKEQGYELEFYTTRGLVAAKGLDPEKAQVLYEGFSKIMETQDVKDTMGKIGLGIHVLNPSDYAVFLKGLVGTAVKSLQKVGLY